VWHPGVAGRTGVAVNNVPSTLYCTEKPGIAVTAGKTKAEAQVLAGAVIAGAAGKMTTLTVFPGPQRFVPAVPAGVFPQSAETT